MSIQRAPPRSIGGSGDWPAVRVAPLDFADEGLEGRAVIFDVDAIAAQGVASAAAAAVRYKPLRNSDERLRSSVVCDLRTPVDNICERAAKHAGANLAAIEFVRQYVGPPFWPDRRAFRIVSK